MEKPESGSYCNLNGPDFSGVETVALAPDPSPEDYLAAMKIANDIADKKLDEHMLLSWYDKDRDLSRLSTRVSVMLIALYPAM